MHEPIPLLEPIPPFEEIYGEDAYLSPRISFVSRGWTRGDRSYGDMLTGRFGTIPGDLPRLLAASAATPDVARWFRLAGLPFRDDTDQFADEAQHEERLRAAMGRGLRIASQFPIWEDHWAAPHALNPTELHSRLADKRSISDLVPEPLRPGRRIVEGPDFTAGRVQPPLPCVVKVSSRFAATAGHGVQICLAPGDLDAARIAFERAERVVIEEHLPFQATFCFHGAACGGGRAALLGATEQIIVNRSHYGGGWYGRDVDPPEPAWHVAREVMRRIAGTGFRGIVGIDLGILPDGSARAFDINPRVNASTSGLWLARFRPEFKTLCGRMQAWRSGLSWEETGRIIEPEITSGRWIPLAIRDPSVAPGQSPMPMMLGVALGASRGEAEGAAADLRDRLRAEIP